MKINKGTDTRDNIFMTNIKKENKNYFELNEQENFEKNLQEDISNKNNQLFNISKKNFNGYNPNSSSSNNIFTLTTLNNLQNNYSKKTNSKEKKIKKNKDNQNLKNLENEEENYKSKNFILF